MLVSNSNHRAYTSLMALVITSWLSLLVLAQFQGVLVAWRTAGYLVQGQKKDEALQQMPMLLLADAEAFQGEYEVGEFIFSCEAEEVADEALQAKKVWFHCPIQTGWPRGMALSVETAEFVVVVKDYRDGGGR